MVVASQNTSGSPWVSVFSWLCSFWPVSATASAVHPVGKMLFSRDVSQEDYIYTWNFMIERRKIKVYTSSFVIVIRQFVNYANKI